MYIEVASPRDKMSESGSSLLRLLQNKDTARLDLLVRESLQNSLDAGDKSSEFVSVDIITEAVDTNKIRNYFEGIEEKLIDKYGDECNYIAIKDTNTVGLTGPIRNDDIGSDGKYGNFLKLVYEISKPQEQHGSGGSWGLGKTVYFRIGAGLVVYYSRIINESGKYESRLAAALVEDETKPDTILPKPDKGIQRGIAWWGDLDNEDPEGKATIPVRDENRINEILDAFDIDPFSGEETGTIIIIPFIDRDALLKETVPVGMEEDYQIPYWCRSSIEDYLKIAVQRWYSPRIQNKKYDGQYLNILINEEKITYSKMEPVFQLVQCLYNSSPGKETEFNGKKIVSKGIEIRNVFNKGNAQAGNVNFLKVTSEDLKMDFPDNLPSPYYYIDKISSDSMYNDPIVMYTRKPGMIVSYSTTGDWTDTIPKSEIGEFIIAIFVANSKNTLSGNDMTLEEYIRGCEMADHKSWQDWSVDGEKKQIIQRIQRGVRKKIKDDYSTITVGTEDKKNLGLGKALADILLPPTDFTYWDDARGGTTGMGGSGGSGGSSSGGGGTTNRSSHVVLKQLDRPTFLDGMIEMPVRLLFGKKKKASLEIVVDAEGRSITNAEWDDSIGSQYPVKLISFTLTSISKGKGDNKEKVISSDVEILGNMTAGNVEFAYCDNSDSSAYKGITISTPEVDDYVIDGVLKYSLKDVQGTIRLTEEE